MRIARLLLRLTVGGLFIGHGTQKLFGWFEGGGLDATGQFFEGQLGLYPGKRHALAAGAAEAGGGTLLAAGLATPLAAATIGSVMLTAIRRAHLKNGVWVTKGGYEYNLVLILAVLLLAEEGPGALSLDAALGRELKGPVWGLFALAGALVGAEGAHRAAEAGKVAALAQREATQPPAAASSPPDEQGDDAQASGVGPQQAA